MEVIKAKNNELERLRRDLLELKDSYTTRVSDLEKENDSLTYSLRSTQKLTEVQTSENKKLMEKKAD
jgi:cell shape-determining protein MreC